MPSEGPPFQDFEATIEHETEKAYLLNLVNTDQQQWCPKSQIQSQSEPDDDGICVFTVAGWWVEKYLG